MKKMGCDYCITKMLHIYYGDDNDSIVYELERQKCYYKCDYDEDEEDYEEKVAKYISDCLIPRMNPILMYENGNFVKPLYETKYKNIIDRELRKYNILWSSVKRIIKTEHRFER